MAWYSFSCFDGSVEDAAAQLAVPEADADLPSAEAEGL